MSPFGNPLLRPPRKTGTKSVVISRGMGMPTAICFPKPQSRRMYRRTLAYASAAKVSPKFSLFRPCRVNQTNRKQYEQVCRHSKLCKNFVRLDATISALACEIYKGRKSSPPSAANDCFGHCVILGWCTGRPTYRQRFGALWLTLD